MNYNKKTKNQLLEEIEELKSKIDTLRKDGAEPADPEDSSFDPRSRFFDQLFAFDSVVIFAADGRIVDLNGKAALRYGIPRDEIIGKSEEEIIDPALAVDRKIKLAELIKSREPVRWQEKRNDIWFDSVMYRSEDIDSGEFRVIEVSRDVTKLKNSELEFREILENSLQGIVIYQDQRIVYSNSRTAKMFNVDLKDVYSIKTLGDIFKYIHPDDRSMLEEYLWKHIEGISVPHRFEIRGLKSDKSLIWVEGYTVFTDYLGKPAIQISLIDISERKRADEAFRESEERFKIASILASDSIYEVNLENNQAKVYSGSKISEKLNIHTEIMSIELWSRFIHPEDRERIESAKERLHTYGEPFSEEYRLLLDDNRVVHLLSRAYVIRNENGRPVKEIGVTTDITERKTAEEVLEREKKLFLGGPLVVFKWSPKELWPVDYVSNNITHFGFAPEDFTSGRILFSNLIHKEDFKSVAGVIRNYTDAGVTFFEHDYRIRNATGETMWVYDFTVVNRNRSNEVINYESYILDITDRKNIEEALKLNKERYSLAVEAGKVVVWDWDLQTDKRYTSSSINKLLGYTEGEIGEEIKDWNKYIHPEDRGIFIRERMKCFDDTTDKIEYKYRMVHRDGSVRWMLSRGIILRNESGKAFRMMGTETDITEIIKLEKELIAAKEDAEKASAIKSEFLANMSHELKTPLHGILGYTQLLRRDNRLPESTAAGLDVIFRSGEHLSKVINDLLNFSKIETGSVSVEKVNFRFLDMLNRITELFRIGAQDKKIAFNFVVSPDIPAVVLGDEKILSQIIVNLIDNAIKFTYQGEILFSVERIRELIRFTLTDTGIGIPRDYLREIFKPFKKMGGQNRILKGTGLGLTISRELVGILGGELKVKSEVGKGSTFSFEIELPAVEDRIDIDSSKYSRINGYKGDKKIILVVDDIDENRNFLALLLKSLGFIVYEAANGIEALDRVVKHRPHLVLLDILMPKMDGINAVKKMRAETDRKEIKIVALTASIIDKKDEKKLEKIFDGLITKPVHIDEIFSALQESLNIEWIYDSSRGDQAFDISRQSKDLDDSTPPSFEAVEELYLLARNGDILGLQEKLRVLDKLPDTYSDFVKNFKTAVLNFEIKKIRDFAIKQLEKRNENF